MTGKRFDYNESEPQYTVDEQWRIKRDHNNCEEGDCTNLATHEIAYRTTGKSSIWNKLRKVCSNHAYIFSEEHGGIKP